MSSCPSLPTGPRKPCVVTYFTQVDKSSSSEPPPQPRVRRVTTVINSLAVVIRDTPTDIGVWVLTACQEKILPKTKPHLFVHCRLGTWMTVGVYPDGTVASFSPWTFILSAYPMSVDQGSGQLFLKIKGSEFQYEKTITQKEFIETHLGGQAYGESERNSAHLFMVPGFGLVLAHHDFLQRQKDECDNLAAWIQWCGDASRGCCWIVNSLSNNVEEKFSERDLKEASEIIKNRERPDDFPIPSKRVVARHFGLITDVNLQKNSISVWSPDVALECDHHAKIPLPPNHREVDSSILPPLIGQWVQFDIEPSDMKQYMTNKTGCRLVIPEYLPITSPAGVGVAHSNRVVRIMISSILVKGTALPTLFELPHFGYVLDRKMALISGAHMQLVLEKTSNRIRKASGVCWVVIDSVQVNPDDFSVEPMQEMLVYFVPLKDAMEVSVITPIERPVYHSKEVFYPIKQSQHLVPNFHTGITTLKHQQPHETYYPEQRRDYYDSSNRNNEHNYYNYKKKQQTQYTGASMEGVALVEKIQVNGGVLWMIKAKITSPIEAHNEDRTFPFTVHFISDGPVDISIGDYLKPANLVQRADENAKYGFRWVYVSSVKDTPTFAVSVKSHFLTVNVVLYANGFDRFKRQVYWHTDFPSVVDPSHFLSNTPTTAFYANITRKKVTVPNVDHPPSGFSWVLADGNITPVLGPQPLHPFQRRRGFRPLEANRSENSSTSPPLKTATEE